MAKNGYTWKEILHYYYDNAHYNYPNVGIVKIDHECKHAKSFTYSSNTKQHWYKCTICHKKFNTANHSWVVYSGYHRCSVCGRLKETALDSIHASSNYVAID